MKTTISQTCLCTARRPRSAFAFLAIAGLAVLLVTALPSHATLIVDLPSSTEWVTSTATSSRTASDTTGDYGSGSAIDRRNVVPFDTTTPMFTSAQTTVQSGKFYGGKNNTFFNNTTTFIGAENRLTENGSGVPDSYYFGSSSTPGSGISQYAALVSLWKQEDFLNGGAANQVNITSDTAFSVMIGAQLAFTGRWLVQIGSTYYVSQESFTTNTTFVPEAITSSNATTTLWAPIDLTANSGDLTAAPGTYTSLTLNNINGVGLYASFPTAVNNGGGRWRVQGFSVDAAVIPEPSSLALLGGAFAFAIVLRRRRRVG